MADNEIPPIIIKKVKGHGGHHGGAWKVAFADFVTAMMALFIVLWVLGQNEEVLESVSGYFKDPVGFSKTGGSLMDGKTSGVFNTDAYQEQLKRDIERREMQKMGDEIMEELSENAEFVNLMDQIVIEMVDEGLRIELMESANEIFFEIGSSKLNPNADKILEKIGAQLAEMKNKIVIEGHTDSRPYSGNAFYTNYELSTDRANSARRSLIKGGLGDYAIDEIRGYADNRLRDADNPYSIVNRRISIILKYTEKN